jgi:predicted nucleic acid-binding protein
LTLVRSLAEVWPTDFADVLHARVLHSRHRGLGARDLLHLACCQRRGITQIKTFDTALASAFGS